MKNEDEKAISPAPASITQSGPIGPNGPLDSAGNPLGPQVPVIGAGGPNTQPGNVPPNLSAISTQPVTGFIGSMSAEQAAASST